MSRLFRSLALAASLTLVLAAGSSSAEARPRRRSTIGCKPRCEKAIGDCKGICDRSKHTKDRGGCRDDCDKLLVRCLARCGE